MACVRHRKMQEYAPALSLLGFKGACRLPGHAHSSCACVDTHSCCLGQYAGQACTAAAGTCASCNSISWHDSAVQNHVQ